MVSQSDRRLVRGSQSNILPVSQSVGQKVRQSNSLSVISRVSQLTNISIFHFIEQDLINRGGENVYPAEVEYFLHTHPKIQDVQVVT